MLSYGHGGAQGSPSDRPHYFAFFQNSLYSKVRSYFTLEKKLTKVTDLSY